MITFRRDRAVRKWCQEHGVEWIGWKHGGAWNVR